MAYGNNNSRNIANLLKYEPLDPIQPRRLPVQQPEPIFPPNPRGRQEIPYEEVFTPDGGAERRSYRRRPPLSSGNGGQGSLNL